MNKSKKFVGHDYLKIKEEKENGKYITIPHAIYGVQDSERVKEIREMFREHYFSTVNRDKMEEIIDYLNDVVDCGESDFEMPMDSDEDHIIEFDCGVALHLNCIDEYHGQGDFETGMSTDGLLIENPDVTDEQLQEIIRWMQDVFFNSGDTE